MVRVSSTSSSASSRKQSKKKREKSKSKKNKQQKKELKKDKKERQRAERADAWDCDRTDAVRLLRQLLQIDPRAADDLKGVFCAIDNGEIVTVNGLEDKHVKKKLRHLLQALRLTPTEDQGFRTADRKVSFTALFQACLRKAR
eukprot:CAMPEP_0175447768 /NCGR_PEP_ID=MMETSP0095-20121207/60980_1 /TAXON_ID=311494 /ORGANISM="Alexandrium monilatum, Strain CCMP3105" /LENGTH=142 /DNA_ID=CAMNT_0016748131 /DNA_START=81 /DNA_END=506 /DNA_ORIENTATION=+